MLAKFCYRLPDRLHNYSKHEIIWNLYRIFSFTVIFCIATKNNLCFIINYENNISLGAPARET